LEQVWRYGDDRCVEELDGDQGGVAEHAAVQPENQSWYIRGHQYNPGVLEVEFTNVYVADAKIF
jgi:hypothetical protein